MTVQHITGDCRAKLRKLPAESVHACVTSPPYYGLRDYSIAPSIWGGDPKCRHIFADETIERELRKGEGLARLGARYKGGGHKAGENRHFTIQRGFCIHCNAWRGCFGLEPTYQLYLEHIVEIFREVWRVLRKDGNLFINMGDAYANRACGWEPEQYIGLDDRTFRKKPMSTAAAGGTAKTNNGKEVDWGFRSRGLQTKVLKSLAHRQPQGLREKNLMGMPWRVAFALQDDGWILRRDNIWFKSNPMPDSVYDRTTTSHEYVFHFAKSNRTRCWRHAVTEEWVWKKPEPDYIWRNRATRAERREKPRYHKAQGWIRINLWRGFDYYYDFAAIMESSSPNSHARAARSRSGSHPSPNGWDQTNGNGHHGTIHRGRGRPDGIGMERWNAGGPNSRVNVDRVPRSRKLALHASNGTRPRIKPNDSYDLAVGSSGVLVPMRNKRSVWPIATKPFKEAHFATFPPKLIEPCILAGCPPGGTVLDCFGGAGTTGVVADAHGRDAILIEINPSYAAMAKRRIANARKPKPKRKRKKARKPESQKARFQSVASA